MQTKQKEAKGKENVYSVSGGLLVTNQTFDQALAISSFARRPVIWGNKTVGKEFIR